MLSIRPVRLMGSILGLRLREQLEKLWRSIDDPDRALQNLKLILEGRPLVPYVGELRKALGRLVGPLLDALWKNPNPDEALNQFERFLSAAGPRAGLIEILANDERLLTGLGGSGAAGEHPEAVIEAMK